MSEQFAPTSLRITRHLADFLAVKARRRLVATLGIHDIIRLWILLLALGGCLEGWLLL